MSPKGSQAGHFDDPRIMSAVSYRKIIGWSFILVRTECPQGNQNEIPWSTNRNSLMIRRHLTPAEFDTSTVVIATCDATRHYTTWHTHMGWIGKNGSPSPILGTIIKILWKQYPFHQFRFKNSEQHLLLGSGGNQNLRPSCRRPPTRTFHPPVGTLRRDTPALVRVRSPNDGNKLGWS